jgi:hypothetical protein
MSLFKNLTSALVAMFSVVAVAADKPVETNSTNKTATTTSAPADKKAEPSDKKRPKVISPKDKAEKKAKADSTAKK